MDFLNYEVLWILLLFAGKVRCKYVEGTLRTSENWAFLARFCFLSDEGEFEYFIEFNENQGDPNLLLYYDTLDQWPAVYKSSKTCEEREAMLNIQQNQIVNLTARTPFHKEHSGCQFHPLPPTTARPRFTLSVPTIAPKKRTTKHAVIKLTPTKATTTIQTTKLTTFLSSESTTETSDFSTFTTLESLDLLESTTSYNGTAQDNSKSTTFEATKFSSTTEIINTDYETIAYKMLSTITEAPPLESRKPPIKKRSVPINPFPSIDNQRMGRTVSCHQARRFRSSRERWWFIAISNCHGTKGINIDYKLLMTNGPPGDYWHEHFSADEFYILPILMAFSIAYSFLMLGIVVCSLELKSRQLLHTTYKIFVLSVMTQLFGILFQSIVYLKYAVSGLESPKVKRTGAVLMGTSETCFLLLLLLLAKGFTITRGRLPISASVKLTVFMCFYIMMYISLFIYEAEVFDPGEVLYLYESPAGYGLIVLRVAAWVMFIYSTIFTLKHYPEKANFYYPFNIFGTIWFVAGPTFILSANTYIDKWVRESVVYGVLLFIAFGGHLMFLILTMPSVANKNFPYHVRTTQIGVMEVAGNAGNSTIEQFGHHVYEPTNGLREQTVIIPLTRRTEEIFEGMYNQCAFGRHNDPPKNDIVNEENLYNVKDVTTENVLNWSKARRLPPLELPNFERINKNRSSIGSANSVMSGNSLIANPNNILSRRQSLTNQLNLESQNPSLAADVNGTSSKFQDYVKDVPIELFTVSKLVVTTTKDLQKASAELQEVDQSPTT